MSEYSLPISTAKLILENLRNELPLDKVLTDPIIDGESFMDLFARHLVTDFRGDKQKADLLVLESELPCKQQQFELQFIGTNVKGSIVDRLKSQLDNVKTGELDKAGFKDFTEGTARMLSASFSGLHEEWDDKNLTRQSGVPVGFIRQDKERGMTACSHMMGLVKKALDDPMNRGKNPRQIENQTWRQLKLHIDETKNALEAKQRATIRQIEREEALRKKQLARQANSQESSFGLGPDPPEPTGQGKRTRKHRRKGKKNKTKARKMRSRR
jgi:hypothetical protein